jgi:hypothetical protein
VLQDTPPPTPSAGTKAKTQTSILTLFKDAFIDVANSMAGSMMVAESQIVLNGKKVKRTSSNSSTKVKMWAAKQMKLLTNQPAPHPSKPGSKEDGL